MIDIQWLIGGEAGYGILTTGNMMSKIFTRLGLSVFDYVEYPSLIRGGHNAYYVRASDVEIFSQKRAVDILVALNRATIDRHKNELASNAVVVYDPNVVQVTQEEFSSKILLLPVPFLELTKQLKVDKLMINTVAVGASFAIFSTDFQILTDIVAHTFGKKGQEIINENINTLKAGFEYVKKNFVGKSPFSVEKKTQESLLISGAEAVALGAIKAGLKFAAIYPMTPINAILITLASHALNYNIVVKEPEDEIAGINMAIGASYAGVRSMVATGGGGFALMVEAFGMSSQTEIPLVVVEGMRPGPSSGMPTWTEQGDLRFVLHASQGDYPKVVVAPGDMLEAFTTTMNAFNLAEKYQLPVLILVDKYLMEGHASIAIEEFKVQNSRPEDDRPLAEKFKIERGKMLTDEEIVQTTNYQRYELTEDGISPRSLPGQKGVIGFSDSYEHDDKGLYAEDGEMRVKMMDKRFKKLEKLIAELPSPQLLGDQETDITILAFGSTKMPVLEAMKILKSEGVSVNFLSVAYLYPFPTETVSSIIKSAKKALVIEGNKTGQFEGLIREHTGLSIDHNLRKYDGRPFYPEEIVEKVKSLVTSS